MAAWRLTAAVISMAADAAGEKLAYRRKRLISSKWLNNRKETRKARKLSTAGEMAAKRHGVVMAWRKRGEGKDVKTWYRAKFSKNGIIRRGETGRGGGNLGVERNVSVLAWHGGAKQVKICGGSEIKRRRRRKRRWRGRRQ